MIKDSGNRQEFETGAVRDMQEGKGRCDLLPLDVIADLFLEDKTIKIFSALSDFMNTGCDIYLTSALCYFSEQRGWGLPTMLLEVAKHFEEGAKKYGENNWQKGLPVESYINSGVRHYLKWLRGDDDEPHDRAFCWNIICCIWTHRHCNKEE